MFTLLLLGNDTLPCSDEGLSLTDFTCDDVFLESVANLFPCIGIPNIPRSAIHVG